MLSKRADPASCPNQALKNKTTRTTNTPATHVLYQTANFASLAFIT